MVADVRKPGEVALDEGREILNGKLYPNMDELPELSVSTVLANLEGLFRKDQVQVPGQSPVNKVYSTVGPVLIAMNPFEDIGCFNATWAQLFRKLGATGKISTAPATYGPHCYCTIESAYQDLTNHQKQAIVICGESGAGKTVTNKIMMDYLFQTDQVHEDDMLPTTSLGSTPLLSRRSVGCHSGGRMARSLPLKSAGAGGMPLSSVKKAGGLGDAPAQSMRSGRFSRQLAAGNSLLEAFGNSKTPRNDNSSRFGKLSTISFNGSPLAVGSLSIEHYLLERSRISSPPEGERNYHIMHQLAAASEEGAEHFNYVRAGLGSTMADGTPFDDEEDLLQVKVTMLEAGFSSIEVEGILKAIEAVLYLGNVEFEDVPGLQTQSQVKGGASAEELGKACERLGIDAQRLTKTITEMELKMPGETLFVKVDAESAKARLDSVAKLLYSRIFDHIIVLLNTLLGGQRSAKRSHSMGLLDIFGFEDMKINVFEQLFINLTNEQIQCMFNDMMIQKEADIYQQEGISDCVPPAVNESRACVELFTSVKPTGIISALAEALSEPGEIQVKDGGNLVRGLFKKCQWSPHIEKVEPTTLNKEIKAKEKRFNCKIKLLWEECFKIKHYAGTIMYTAREFLPKSKDSVDFEVVQVFQSSARPDVADMFANEQKGSNITVGEKFRNQLRNLTDELSASQITFVRCIKPTPSLLPKRFDPDLVVEQLHCGGVVAALEVRRSGLPDRLKFTEFVQAFLHLTCGKPEVKLDDAKVAKAILETLLPQADVKGMPDYVFGRTRIFFRSGVLPLLRRMAGFKKWFYVNMVQQAYRARSGRKAIHDIAHMDERLHEMSEQAESMGLLEEKDWLDASKTARTAVQALQKKVVDFQQKYEDLLASDPKKAYIELPKLIRAAEVDDARKKFNSVTGVLAEHHERQFGVKKILDAQLAEKMRTMDGFFSKLEHLQEQVGGESEEEQALRTRIVEAQAKLRELNGDKVDSYVQRALDEFDIKAHGGDATQIRLPEELDSWCADMGSVVEDVAKAVDAYEQHQVERRKRLQEAMPQLTLLHDAVAGKQGQLDDTLQVIRGIAGANGQAEDFQGTQKAISEAMGLHLEMEEEWARGCDSEAIERTLAAFFDSVKRVEREFEAERKQHEERMEAHHRRYTEIVSGMGNYEDLRRAALRFSQLMEASQRDLVTNASAGAGCGERARALGDLHKDIDAVAGSIVKFGFHPKPGENVLKENTMAEGAWHVENCFRLSPNVDELKSKALMLDRTKYSSVVAAVDALNRHHIQAPAGYCLVYSDRLASFCLLFATGKAAEACDAVGGMPPTTEERAQWRKDETILRKEKQDLNRRCQAAERSLEALQAKPEVDPNAVHEVLAAHEEVRNLGEQFDTECQWSNLLVHAILGNATAADVAAEEVEGSDHVVAALEEIEDSRMELQTQVARNHMLIEALKDVKLELLEARESADRSSSLRRQWEEARHQQETGPMCYLQDALRNLMCQDPLAPRWVNESSRDTPP